MTDDIPETPQTPAKGAAYRDTLFEFPTEYPLKVAGKNTAKLLMNFYLRRNDGRQNNALWVNECHRRIVARRFYTENYITHYLLI